MEASNIVASAPADEAPAIRLVTRHAVALHPHDRVTFAALPEKDRGGEDRFSGLLKVEVRDDGICRISASSGVWIDAVAGGKVVKNAGFEMQTKCPCSRALPVASQAVRWALQFNGSRSSTVDIAITLPHEY